MRRHSRPCLLVVQFALVAALLLPTLPPTVARAEEQPIPQQTAPELPSDIVDTPPTPITVPPLEGPHLPSLALRLQAEPLWAAVGDVITATITVFNQAPDPANDLTLTLGSPYSG